LLDAGPRVARIFTFRERGFSGSVTSNLSLSACGHNGSAALFNRLEPVRPLAYSAHPNP